MLALVGAAASRDATLTVEAPMPANETVTTVEVKVRGGVITTVTVTGGSTPGGDPAPIVATAPAQVAPPPRVPDFPERRWEAALVGLERWVGPGADAVAEGPQIHEGGLNYRLPDGTVIARGLATPVGPPEHVVERLLVLDRANLFANTFELHATAGSTWEELVTEVRSANPTPPQEALCDVWWLPPPSIEALAALEAAPLPLTFKAWAWDITSVQMGVSTAVGQLYRTEAPDGTVTDVWLLTSAYLAPIPEGGDPVPRHLILTSQANVPTLADLVRTFVTSGQARNLLKYSFKPVPLA